MAFSAPTGLAAPKSNISSYKLRQVPNFSPEQMQLFQSLLGRSQKGTQGGVDFLSQLASGDEGAFAQDEAPAYSAFNKALGNIGSRFAGAGALGSSAFQNATSGAAANLAENLQSKRSGLRQSAIDQLLGLSSSLLSQRPHENILEQEDEGFDWGGLLGGIAGSFGGPALGALGKGVGSWANKRLFG